MTRHAQPTRRERLEEERRLEAERKSRGRPPVVRRSRNPYIAAVMILVVGTLATAGIVAFRNATGVTFSAMPLAVTWPDEKSASGAELSGVATVSGAGNRKEEASTGGAPAGATAKAAQKSVAPSPPTQEQADDPRVRDTEIDPSDNEHPAVAQLDPALRKAIQKASRGAARDGVADFYLTSGWRPASYQQELWDEEVRKMQSESAAARKVKKPDASEHVHGAAVDVGPTEASYWMADNSEDYGLCRTYANEIWHYELMPKGKKACPPMKKDASVND